MKDMEKDFPIVVIGAGAGGLTAAATLAECGHKVILVERGEAIASQGYPTNQYDYELSPKPWLRHSDEWEGPVKIQRGIGLGGSTLYFQALSHMPPLSVFKSWGLNTEIISSITRDVVAYLKIAGETQPNHEINPISEHLLKSARNIGWKARHAPVAILSRPYNGRPACNYCGQCVYGCRLGDKSSVDKTWLQRGMNSRNLTVLTNSLVEKIELISETRAGSVHVGTDGQNYKIAVSAVIVAAGVLETPYLLKGSRQHHAPNGIGNVNVGRNMSATLWCSNLISLPKVDGVGYAGVPIDLLVEEFEDEGYILCQGRNTAGILGPISAARYYCSRHGCLGVREWMKNNYSKLAGLGAYAESSVDFNDGLSKEGGKKYNKSVTNSDNEILNKMKGTLQNWRYAAKATLLDEFNGGEFPYMGSMFRGTCRMGGDLKNSAVGPDGILHGYENILVCDSSILGRGFIADPSLPLQVLSVHIARQLSEKIKIA